MFERKQSCLITLLVNFFFAGVVAADVATLAAAGVVTLCVVSFADPGAGTVGMSDLADAGLALPADHAGAGTVGVSVLADAGMVLPADLAGVATVGVATLADANVNVDSGNRRVWCTGNYIDEGGGVYAPFRPDMFCGGGSYRSGLRLDIYQVNVAAVEGPGDEHFVGFPGLPSTRGSGTIFPVLGLPSDGPDLWNFDHMDSLGPSMISETSPAPTGAGDSVPDPPVLRYEFRLSGSESKTDYGAGTLHVSASSSFAWPIFFGNLDLGSGWPWLGSGGPQEDPDVDDDITNRLSQIIAQHNGKLLLKKGFVL